MGYSNSYRPSYYSTLHDSITSLCKTLLPFNMKKPCLPIADRKLLKLQSDNLKWQQDSFHRIINLMGLHKEGIAQEIDVSTFRSNLLDTLIASPPQYEQPVILRDKLLFLQELLYAKCISVYDYHSSKRPLLQRMAVQGAEIEVRDVIVGRSDELKPKENAEEEEQWSEIDLREEKCLLKKDKKLRHASALKKIKEASSVFGFVSPYRIGKSRTEKSIFEIAPAKVSVMHFEESPYCNGDFQGKESESSSILMAESSSNEEKKKPFRALFHQGLRNQTHNINQNGWGFERKELEDETTPLHINGRSDDSETYFRSVSNHRYEMEKKKKKKKESVSENSGSKLKPWTTFQDDENCHPNLFVRHDYVLPKNVQSNPFLIGSGTTKKTEEQILITVVKTRSGLLVS